jgi:hypothetical protein
MEGEVKFTVRLQDDKGCIEDVQTEAEHVNDRQGAIDNVMADLGEIADCYTVVDAGPTYEGE